MSSYIPVCKGAIEGYVVNFLVKQLWRIATTHTHEEAMQEAYIVFMRVCSKYPIVENGAHFMSLFKTSWINEFNDLSEKATRARVTVSSSDLTRVDENGDSIDAPIEMIGSTDNDGMLKLLLQQAPKEVALVLNLFLNAPPEVLELAMQSWSEKGKHNAGGERFVEKMLGMKPGTNPIEMVRNYMLH